MPLVHSASKSPFLIRRALRLTLATLTASALGAIACGSPDPTVTQTTRPASDVQIDTTEVVHGVPSRGRDPAVVALDINGEGLCTGALIAQDVVLTARHCVSRTSEQVACPPTSRQVLSDRAPSTIRVFVGDEITSARLVARGEELFVPPVQQLCDADIAVLILDRSVEGVDPLVLGDRAVAKGERVRAVGFGRQGDGDSAGDKLFREHVRVLDASATEFLVGEATCQGDSGGPALDEETGAVVGVVSRGGPTCEGANVHNIYTRVDTFNALIEDALTRAANRYKTPTPVLTDAGAPVKTPKADAGTKRTTPKPQKPASDMGAACTVASDCAAGFCVTEADRRYCSRSCGTGDRCPTGFNCKGTVPSTTPGGPATQVCLQR